MSVEMVKAKLNGKYDIILPKHRANRPEYHSEAGWERARLDSLHANLIEGDVVFYVGVELGEHTALCSMWGADVVMFEPNYKSWPVVKAIYDANNLKPPLKCFLGFASDVTKLDPPTPDTAIYGGKQWEVREDGWPICVDEPIVEAHGFNQLYEEADGLPQITIDDFVEQTGIVPTVITMDVEGSEGRVLRGAEQTLRKYKPKLWLSIHPEFLILNYGEWSYELRNWVKDLGYHEKILDFQHELHTVTWPVGTELKG